MPGRSKQIGLCGETFELTQLPYPCRGTYAELHITLTSRSVPNLCSSAHAPALGTLVVCEYWTKCSGEATGPAALTHPEY